jgi:outer membrane protein TolC
VQAALAGQSAAEAAFYPDINLAAFAGQTAISLSSLMQAGSTTFGFGPTLHLPLYRPQLNAELHGASAEVSERVAAYNGAVVGAVQQVADQLTQVQSLALQISDQAESLRAAEQAYQLATERYGAGLANYLDVLNAESEVLEARRQRVELACSQLISRVTLLLAVGGSFHLASVPQVNALNAGANP